jgi:hypothetical protein
MIHWVKDLGDGSLTKLVKNLEKLSGTITQGQYALGKTLTQISR